MVYIRPETYSDSCEDIEEDSKEIGIHKECESNCVTIKENIAWGILALLIFFLLDSRSFCTRSCPNFLYINPKSNHIMSKIGFIGIGRDFNSKGRKLLLTQMSFREGDVFFSNNRFS